MLDAAAYLKTQQLPIKYLQIDSWFYKKGHKDGTRTWAPEKSIFPNGFENLYAKTGLPIGCHNRYWDNDTTYARYNGGKYNFIPDTTTGCAVPDDQGFWNDLFNSTQKWGKFILYEQDWLNAETDRNMVLLTDLFLGRRWLIQMGLGAAKFGVAIQYCMAYSRHILQSLEVPIVTQARASDDYATGEKQWKIGTTAMFIDAMQLAPSKDTFWTSLEEPGNPYKRHEDMPYVQAMVATYSTGPVGPGDGIGYVNASLLMKCCNSDGLILRASRPLTIMDKSLKQAAFVGGNPMGQGEALYSTIANISGHIFGTILATDVNGTYNLEPMDLTPDYPGQNEDMTTFIYNSFTGKFRAWSSSLPLIVDATTCGTELCVFYSTSLIRVDAYNTRVGLLGEMNSKFSPVSPQRFFALRTTETSDLEVQVRLSAGENIDVWFLALLKGSSFTLFLECDNTHSTKPAVFVATLKVNGDSRCAVAV
ncbi:non-lysosomal glucosylceramidase [Plakobranchus ocellatus]|uniref:Non-lysosomal glucosylceramidase n=1 Tax=Plakobranchus ocellatus TaxID=259542 RepID=A0AAV4D6C0_9GAST|nr:non-lysosomal glucosylceramidase [Plakobranchus ocellatus]